MLRRHVERFEVVVIVFELGPLDDEEAEAEEDRLDPLAQQRQRMAMADERRTPGQRDVDRAGLARAIRGGLRDGGEPRVDGVLDVLLESVGRLAETRTLVGAGAGQ